MQYSEENIKLLNSPLSILKGIGPKKTKLFEKLKGKICSCHLKDVVLKPEFTCQLEETACGKGILDIELFAELATKENQNMPMIIEHLTTDQEYIESVKYVQKRLGL